MADVRITGTLEMIYTNPATGGVVSESLPVDIPSPTDEPLDLRTGLAFTDPAVDVRTTLEPYLVATYGLTGLARVTTPRAGAVAEWTATNAAGVASAIVDWLLGSLLQVGAVYKQTVLGNTSTAGQGYQSVEIGEGASAAGKRAVAIGANSTVPASSDDGLAVGTAAMATAKDSMAVGQSARATMPESVAVGQGADAGGQNSIVLGKQAASTAAAPSSVALGWEANVRATSSVAIGNAAIADVNAYGAVALGWVAEVSGSNAVAIGPLVKATGNESIAIGSLTLAEGADSIAIGRDATTLPAEAKHIDLAGRVLRMAVRAHNGSVLPGYPGVIQIANNAGVLRNIYPPDVASNSANASITVTNTTPGATGPEGLPIAAAAATVSGLTPGSVRKVVGNVSIRMNGAPSTAGQWGFRVETSSEIVFIGVRSTDVPTQLSIYDFTYSLERTVGSSGTISVVPAIKWGAGTFNISWASATITVL